MLEMWRWGVWLFKSSFKTLSTRLIKPGSRCLQFPLFMISCKGKLWKCLMGCLWWRTLCVLLLLLFFLAALETCLASQSIFREKHRSSTLLYKMFRMFSTPWCSTHGLFQKETSNKYAIAMKSLDGYFSAQINIPFERQAGKARTVRHWRSMHDDIISFITELWIWRC